MSRRSDPSDPERGQALRELVREDGRVDMDELRIVVRQGVVHLRGMLASEAEHQILLGLVRDVAGIQEVDDRLAIKAVCWKHDEPGEGDTPE